MKVKGLTLTESTLNIVNIKKMFEMAKASVDGDRISVTCPQQNIVSNEHHTVLSKQFNKVYSRTSDKRRLVGEVTFPYGFKIQE